MKAVVTGSAGFIGSHLVDALTGRGYRVTGIDRQSKASSGRYEHMAADLSERTTAGPVAGALEDADIVFHLAARPGVRDSGPVIEEMRRRDNVVATRNLLAMVPRPTMVVAVSSSAVYGGSRGGVPSRETDPLRPRGGYARSKTAMEELCQMRRAAGGPTAVIRPFTVAGEGQRSDMAFSLWHEALTRGEPIRLFGSPARSRDITDVRHVAEGLIRAGERRVDGTVNLGSGVGHRLIDMARALLDASGLDGRVIGGPVSPQEADATLADTATCRRLLGFVPVTDLPALLARQISAAARPRMLVAR